MLEPDWTDWQDISHLPSTIVTSSSHGSLWPHQEPLREDRAHCRTVAHRSAIKVVSASFVAKCKSSKSFIVNMWERIGKILEEEEEGTPHKPADLETWQLQIKKAFPDFIELPTGVPPPLKRDFCIDTDPAAKLPYLHRNWMSDSECLESEGHIAKSLANGRVTGRHSRSLAPVIVVNKLDGCGLQMCVDCCGLNAITRREQHPLPFIYDLIDWLHRSRVLAKFYLASGYDQLHIHLMLAMVAVLDLAGSIGLRGNGLTQSTIYHVSTESSHSGHIYLSEWLVFGM